MSDFIDDYERKIRALGRELLRGRERRDFSRARVGKLLGVSDAQVWKFEEGRIAHPSKLLVRRVEKLLGVWKREEDEGGSYVLAKSPNFVKVGEQQLALL